MSFDPCPSCRRHVAPSDATCPFCGARTSLPPRVAISYAARLTRAAIFAGAAACSSTPPARTPPPPPVEYPFALPAAPSEGRASVSGVVRQDNHRKAGMSVKAENSDGTTVEARTNEKGEYAFLDLEPGEYMISADPGYQNPRPQDGPVIQQPIRVQLAPNVNERYDLTVVGPMPYVRDTGPCCKPYGAPPARKRVV